ncbi:MAG TPA: sialidase family protein [Tepidisphaeraceae bacterium]|nr:sialidase family protein [Tepidisphaeraceae bacterium]
MGQIEALSQVVIYDNPVPTLRSRHGFFPGIARVPSGDLVALVSIGEAFESNDQQTFIVRSTDRGRTWRMQGPLHREQRRGLGSLKPTLIENGALIAVGYMFYRDNPDTLVNPDTGGLPGGDNLVSFSTDEGRTWSLPVRMDLTRPEILELAGPCIQLRGSGELLALASPLTRWDGTRPSGNVGIVLRSKNRGLSWNDRGLYFDHPGIMPLEARVCQMEDGRVVGIVWALDEERGVALNNHLVVSRDEGKTWSPPTDIGIAAQASNLLPLRGNQLLSIHAHRECEPTGVIVRLCALAANDGWTTLTELNLWDRAVAKRVTGFGDMGTNLKFGQPALLALGDSEYLAYHWSIENGQGRILGHRIRVHE